MATIVVGGHSRKVGKTSVAAGLIAALPEYSWTAIKISQHWHETEAEGTDFYSIAEEQDRRGQSDTSRFLAAGASRSIWIRIRDNRLASAMPELMEIIRSNPYVIIESNSILRFIQPELFILVLNYGIEEFKKSAHDSMKQAHAVLVVDPHASPPAWKNDVLKELPDILICSTTDPGSIPAELIKFIRSRIDLGE
jgi:molybdopterin-guanine dinucleotide biosynthesis protein